MRDDAELLRAYAENKSEAAFAEFVGRRIDFVYATALRQLGGNAQMAEDVAQLVFIEVARRAGALATHERLAGWLHATASNLAHKLRRDAWRRDKREQEAIRMSDVNRNNEGVRAHGVDSQIADELTVRELLDEALRSLRAGEREAVLLRFFEGRAFAEIGAKLEMSEDAARMRVARAIEKMRDMLGKKGVTSSAAALGVLMSAEAAHAAPAGLAVAVTAGAVSAAGMAGIATTSVIVGGFLAFMSSTKISVVVAVLLMLAVGGFFYSSQSERVTLNALNEAQRENRELLEKQRAAENYVTQEAVAKPHDRVAAGNDFLAAYPAIKEFTDAKALASAAEEYYRLYRELGWSREKWEQFVRLTGPQNVPNLTFYLKDFGPVEVRVRDEDDQWRDKLKGLLGHADFAKFLEVEGKANWPKRQVIDQLALDLYFTEAPLTAAQGSQLNAILMSTVTHKKGDQQPPVYDWDAILNQARPFLADPQLQALTRQKARDEWNREETELKKSLEK